MTKYVCENGHKFIHPEIDVYEYPNTLAEQPQSATLSPASIQLFKVTSQYHTCPWCHSLKFDEYIEPQPEIISMKSIDINQVDDYIKQGYKVKDSSTTKAAMVKYAVPCPEPSSVPLPPPPVTEAPLVTTATEDCMKQAEDAYSKLEGNKNE